MQEINLDKKAFTEYYAEDISQIQEGLSHYQNQFIFSELGDYTSILLDKIEKAATTSHRIIRIDTRACFSPRHLLSMMTREVMKQGPTNLKESFEYAHTYLPNLKPQLYKGPSTKLEMTVNYTINETMIYAFIKELLEALDRIATDNDTRFLIIFDHYDNIINLDKRMTEDIIRQKAGTGKLVDYFFICYYEDNTAKIFDKKYAAKYRIKKMHALQQPDQDMLAKLVAWAFRKKSLSFSEEFCSLVAKKGITLHNVIWLTHILFEQEDLSGTGSPNLLAKAISTAIYHLSPTYQIIWDSLSPHQRILLSAIAAKGGRQIFSTTFLLENGLGAAPSVQTSLSALIKKRLILKYNKEYDFADPFFKPWILNLPG